MHEARPLIAALALLSALTAVPGASAAYPDRPITMIVAYGAGGSTDVTARMLVPYIEKNLGGNARIEIVNKAGAGGEMGFAAIADAVPDGYTIGFINTPNVLTIPIERPARYAPERIDPLVNIVDDPGVMTVRSDSPFRTVPELVGFARDKPDTVTVGSTGVGSDDHLAMLVLQRQARAPMKHVPFPGSAENYRAMLGGHILVSAMNLGEGLRARRSDDSIVLGVMSGARPDLAPDLPTFREQGYDITIAALRGIGAPKGLPADIRTRLVEAITKAADDPEFRAGARETFQPIRVLGPEAFADELRGMARDFRALWDANPWSNR